MLKQLLRKYLLEYTIDEAVPMIHFKDRMSEVVDDVISIDIPPSVYLPNIPKKTQDDWIIANVRAKLYTKIAQVKLKDYPTNSGSCVLVPLGLIKIKPLVGNPVNIILNTQRKEGVMSGYSYYIPIYENRITTIVLADYKTPLNVNDQFNRHINNTLKNGWEVNKNKSFIDKSFMDTIQLNISDFKI